MSIELDDVTAEKEKLEGDRKTLLAELEKYQKAIQQITTQVQQIGGAIQTCEYFINKNNPPQDPETKEESGAEVDKA